MSDLTRGSAVTSDGQLEQEVVGFSIERDDLSHSSLRYDHSISTFDQDTHYGRLLNLVGSGKRVLELGSSTGFLTDVMQQHFDCSVVGVEIDAEAAQLSRARGNIVHTLDLDAVDLVQHMAGGKFDVVLCADVLEHLRNPENVLAACRELLVDDGLLITSIPNASHADIRLALLGGQLPFRPMGLLDHTHVKFFTRALLEQLFESARFKVLSVSRNRWGVSKSEVKPNLPVDNRWLSALLQSDPEAETYQFIVTCRKYRENEALGNVSVDQACKFERVDVVVFESGYQKADDIYQKALSVINYPLSRLRFWLVTAAGLTCVESLAVEASPYGANDFRTFSFVGRGAQAKASSSIEAGATHVNHTNLVIVLREIAQQSDAKYLFLLETNTLPGANCIAELTRRASDLEASGCSRCFVCAEPEIRLDDQFLTSSGPGFGVCDKNGVLLQRSYLLDRSTTDPNFLTNVAQVQDLFFHAVATGVQIESVAAANVFANGARDFAIDSQARFLDDMRLRRKWGSLRNFLSCAYHKVNKPTNVFVVIYLMVKILFTTNRFR